MRTNRYWVARESSETNDNSKLNLDTKESALVELRVMEMSVVCCLISQILFETR